MELRLEDGRAAGTVQVQRLGEDTLFTVTARLPAGLWRITAHGGAGELALGVMEGSGTLRRRFSRSLADRLGEVRHVTAQRCAGARMESEWQACRGDEAPHLPSGALCRCRGQQLTLALPWREDGPFPYPHWFCLARVGQMAGRTWVFYTLGGAGDPVLGEEN